jgi:hypothetical protein
METKTSKKLGRLKQTPSDRGLTVINCIWGLGKDQQKSYAHEKKSTHLFYPQQN